MAINLDNLFEALGLLARVPYFMASGQAYQPDSYAKLTELPYLQQLWLAPLSLSYDASVRTESRTFMQAWSSAAVSILTNMVYEQDQFYGSNIGNSLFYLNQQMLAQGKTVLEYDVGASYVPDAGNVGTGTVFITLQRADGLIQQNTVAEVCQLLITADSYTGGAVVGQEPWSLSCHANVSSLNTGVPVNLWDWDWPQGSGASASGTAISSAQYANPGGNYLTNGDFENWTGTTPALDNWYKETGTWGTSIERASGGIDGGYCVQFNAGATLNGIEQQFGSTTSDGSQPEAGTSAALTSYSSYCASLWLKATGVVSGGVMTVSLVDGSGTVIADQAGVNNSTTIALTGASTSWTNHLVSFRLPTDYPGSNGTSNVVKLRIKITTALAGANLLMDAVCFANPTPLYAGGPAVAVFSNPASPFVAIPDPDGFQLTFTNDYGGKIYGASWQTALLRMFGVAGGIFPYSPTPNISDTLITGYPSTKAIFGPISQATATDGSAIDFSAYPEDMALTLQIAAMAATTVTVTMQESVDGLGSWTTLGVFDTVSGPNALQTIYVTRTKDFVRASIAMTGAAATLISVSGGRRVL